MAGVSSAVEEYDVTHFVGMGDRIHPLQAQQSFQWVMPSFFCLLHTSAYATVAYIAELHTGAWCLWEVSMVVEQQRWCALCIRAKVSAEKADFGRHWFT
jgi:hypothetical protein